MVKSESICNYFRHFYLYDCKKYALTVEKTKQLMLITRLVKKNLERLSYIQKNILLYIIHEISHTNLTKR